MTLLIIETDLIKSMEPRQITANPNLAQGYGYTEEQVQALNEHERARKLVEAGWKAAIDCHTHFGMAGWSIHGDAFRESALQDAMKP